jgi:predicted alpha/beta superfamily hydrolase
MQVPQLLIVGVGYPVGGRQASLRGYRRWDLSPVRDEAWDAANPQGGDSGGGPEFLRFLREELAPLIEAGYRADPTDRAIYGHSMGGLFAIYALLEGEGAFRRAIAASPSLWWSEGYIFRLEQAYSESHSELEARLFMSMGMEEPDDRRYASSCCESITNLRRLAAILDQRQYRGLEFQYHLFEGENHQSVVPAGISRGLRSIYSSPR